MCFPRSETFFSCWVDSFFERNYYAEMKIRSHEKVAPHPPPPPPLANNNRKSPVISIYLNNFCICTDSTEVDFNLRGMDTLSGEGNSTKIVLPSFFLFRVDTFSEEVWCPGKQTGSHKSFFRCINVGKYTMSITTQSP